MFFGSYLSFWLGNLSVFGSPFPQSWCSVSALLVPWRLLLLKILKYSIYSLNIRELNRDRTTYLIKIFHLKSIIASAFIISQKHRRLNILIIFGCDTKAKYNVCVRELKFHPIGSRIETDLIYVVCILVSFLYPEWISSSRQNSFP